MEKPSQLDSKIPMTTTEEAITSVIGTGGESSQLGGLQASVEVAAAAVGETSPVSLT